MVKKDKSGNTLPYLNHDPQDISPQYLEDLSTGYWFSETLFTAVDLDVFTLIEPDGRPLEEISGILNCPPQALERFLKALCVIGLLVSDTGHYYNTMISRKYLVKGKDCYQGDSILWRRNLVSSWQSLKDCLHNGGRVSYDASSDKDITLIKYIKAMDAVARAKVREIMPVFQDTGLEGDILDVGSGSGAISAGFLNQFPSLRANLMDLKEVMEHTENSMLNIGLQNRVAFTPHNILEEWPFPDKHFILVILSNIIHAYSERELPYILSHVVRHLSDDGYILIHDFFTEHCSKKSVLFDLNMFINTYNGMVHPANRLREELKERGLFVTEMIPLRTDTALIVGAKNRAKLERLCLDPVGMLVSRLRGRLFEEVYPVPVDIVHISDGLDEICRFGCDHYGRPHCPPNSPASEETMSILRGYRMALILQGEPPTGDFQRRVLDAEAEAFKEGYHRAFSFWAGPCSICKVCTATDNDRCMITRARPSMEAAGIDVYETVRRAGGSLRTLKERDEFVKYYALLLLE